MQRICHWMQLQFVSSQMIIEQRLKKVIQIWRISFLVVFLSNKQMKVQDHIHQEFHSHQLTQGLLSFVLVLPILWSILSTVTCSACRFASSFTSANKSTESFVISYQSFSHSNTHLQLNQKITVNHSIFLFCLLWSILQLKYIITDKLTRALWELLT